MGETNLLFSFDYTSSSDGVVEWRLVEANTDGTPNFDGLQIAYDTMSVNSSTTPATLTFTYDISDNADPSKTYTWAGKITINGADYAFNNTNNLVNVDILDNTNDIDKNSIILYPNPANDFLNIEFEKKTENIIIYNITGQKIATFKTNSLHTKLAMSQLPKGMYLLKTDSGTIKSFIKS